MYLHKLKTIARDEPAKASNSIKAHLSNRFNMISILSRMNNRNLSKSRRISNKSISSNTPRQSISCIKVTFNTKYVFCFLGGRSLIGKTYFLQPTHPKFEYENSHFYKNESSHQSKPNCLAQNICTKSITYKKNFNNFRLHPKHKRCQYLLLLSAYLLKICYNCITNFLCISTAI